MAILAAHTLALTSLLLWSGPGILRWLIALVVGLSLVMTWRRPWPVRLDLARDGAWQLVYSNGRIERGTIANGRIFAGSVSIRLAGRCSRPFLLLPDTFRDGDHKRLSRLMRHRCGGAAC